MKTYFLSFLCFFITAAAWSDVSYKIVDIDKRIVQLTYELEDRQAGNQTFIFPQDGYIHDAHFEEFRVVEVFDPTRNEDLRFSVQRVKETEAPQLKIKYKHPVAPNQSQKLKITVHIVLPKKDLFVDDQNRLTVSYETSHPIVFILPAGYYLTETNQPVWVYEKEGTIYVQQRDRKPRILRVKLALLKN